MYFNANIFLFKYKIHVLSTENYVLYIVLVAITHIF